MNEEIRYGVKWGECPSCGQRMPVTQNHFCAGKQSHGMDYQSELRAGSTHRVGDIEKMNENKSWKEFIEFVYEQFDSEPDNLLYGELKNYDKIGLLLQYLTDKKQYSNMIHISNLNVDYLEGIVKSLKPVDEVEALAESTKDELQCGCCGDKKVFIRGKYPNSDRRLICPTCSYEKLESINEISNNNYGIPCKAGE